MDYEDGELERFARALIEHLRDQTIRDADAIVDGRLGGVIAERWNRVLGQPTPDAVRDLIPEIVDWTISTLLFAVDDGQLPLAWRTRADDFVLLRDLSPDALMGWFLGAGWREAYSDERYFDPFESADDEPDG